MDTRRLGIALGVALAVSIAITSIFYVRVRRQQQALIPQMKKVVAAAQKLQPGTPLVATNLVTIDWPSNVPLDGAVSKPEEVTGRVLLYPVAANEPIRLSVVSAPNSGIGLTAKIPDGMRATAVKTNEVNNVAGFLFPGCRVDVLATLRMPDNTTVTRTVLQNVQVLSAGEKMEPDPQGKPENVSVITLLTTPEESQKLVLAGNQGSIQFVLRNGGDNAKAEPRPVSTNDLAGIAPKAAPENKPVRRVVSQPKVASVYVVETVAGDKTSVTKF